MVWKSAFIQLSGRRPLRRRRGPAPLPDDSWDDTLALPRPPVESRRPGRHTWAVVSVGVASIVALVTLAIALPGFVGPGTGPTPGLSTQDGAQPAGPGMAAMHSMPVVSTSPPATVTGGPGGTRANGSGPPTDQSGSDSESGSPLAGSTSAPPAVVVEAETGIRAGSAAVTADASASGGAYVDRLGDWGDAAGPGMLVFTSVNLPSTGTWRLTIYFLDPGPTGQRKATVVVSGADPCDIRFAGSADVLWHPDRHHDPRRRTAHDLITNPAGTAPAIDYFTFTLLLT